MSIKEPFQSRFKLACRETLEYFSVRMPMANWMVSRVNGNDWTIFELIDTYYGIQPMTVHDWSDSFSYRMLLGLGPKVAPRCADVPSYVNSPVYSRSKLGAYIAVPLEFPDGRLWGLISGVDPEPMGEELHALLPELELSARFLIHLYECDVHIAQMEAEIRRLNSPLWVDPESGARTRPAWDYDCADDEWARVNHLEAGGVIVVQASEAAPPRTIADVLAHVGEDGLAVYRDEDNTYLLMLRGLIKSEQQALYREVKKLIDRRFPHSRCAYAYRGPTGNMHLSLIEAKKALQDQARRHSA